MRERIADALKSAMKSKEKRRTSTLRLITAKIKDGDIAARTAGQDRITDAEILDVMAKMIKQRRESVTTYEEAGRCELAEQESEEIKIIKEFLPRQLDEPEMRSAISDTIKEIGAAGLKDMGRIMAILKERYAGKMDFARAGAIAKELLK